jgi:hypothetical protein
MSWFDVSQDNHTLHPDIMRGFVATFDNPVAIYANARTSIVGRIVSVDTDGRDLFGEVTWTGDEPNDCVHMNWHFGPSERVGLSDGFLSPYPHRVDWDDDEEADPSPSEPRAAQTIEHIFPMDDDEFRIENIDPGVRRLVAWLRVSGFRTTDSGDGKIKIEAGATEDGGVCPFPHVAMVVEPDDLVHEARRLSHLLKNDHGVTIYPTPPEPTGEPELDVSYNVHNDRAMMVLIHVDDSMLTPS